MNKLAVKFFRVDSTHVNGAPSQTFIDQLIEKHNSDSSNKYTKVETVIDDADFDISLYVHHPSLKPPPWRAMLLEITGQHKDVRSINSLYPSFVLFFHNEEEIYVISGGAGYRAVEAVFDSNFGFNVVERLINTSSDELRGISQRVFLGVELAAKRFFKADYVFNDEDSFGKYYRELEVFIDKEKLRDIGVETPKKKLLIKGELGFKIGTKVSFSEMLDRVKKISELLRKDCDIELNPFKRVTNRELNRKVRHDKTFEQILNQQLSQQYFEEYSKKERKEIYHPKLIEYLNSTEVLAKLEKREEPIETMQKVTPRLILGKLDIPEILFPRFNELMNSIEISLVDEESGKKMYPSKLIDWLHGEVSWEGDRFLKFENEWFRYTLNFSNDLNRRLNQVSESIEMHDLDLWTTDYGTEADYNQSYHKSNNFIVGDAITYKNIELADLITWTDEQLIVIHVKDGLDRDLRVLQSQALNSAKILTDFRSKDKSDTKELLVYYDKLKEASEKFNTFLPEFEDFQEIIYKSKMKIVFAFATKTHNQVKTDVFQEIVASRSTIAKISILHSYYSVRSMDHSFSLAKIIKADASASAPTVSLITKN